MSEEQVILTYDSDKPVISLDSQVLNAVQLCEEKMNLSFVQHIRPIEKAEALERGSLVHSMFEIYESVTSNCISPKSEIWEKLSEIEVTPEIIAGDPLRKTLLAADYLAVGMNLPIPEVELCKYQFQEYLDYYRHDLWKVLAIEEVGSKVMYDGDIRVIYNFKIDRLSQKADIIAPWDRKTSKRRSDVSSLSNQFFGYAWGTDSHYVVVDKIGFQKSLSPAERFQRIILKYSEANIYEWLENTIVWAHRIYEALKNEKYSRNLTSCDKYSGCIFRPICAAHPGGRTNIIHRDYQYTEPWDVAKVLET